MSPAGDFLTAIFARLAVEKPLLLAIIPCRSDQPVSDGIDLLWTDAVYRKVKGLFLCFWQVLIYV